MEVIIKEICKGMMEGNPTYAQGMVNGEMRSMSKFSRRTYRRVKKGSSWAGMRRGKRGDVWAGNFVLGLTSLSAREGARGRETRGGNGEPRRVILFRS